MNKIFTFLFIAFTFSLQAQDFEQPIDFFSSSNFDDEVNYEIFDYDGDGDLDLAGGKNATIYLNDGSNNFDTEIFLSFEEYRIRGDFNGDGLIDFMTTEDLLINNGDDTFTESTFSETNFSVAERVFHIAGDFNNDGYDDLVTWGTVSVEVKFYISYGSADGTLTDTEFLITSAFGFYDAQAEEGDFNGDGHLDLAISTAENSLRIYLNDGSGTFTSEDYEVEGMRFHLRKSDLDQDGDLDLVWGTQSTKVGWALNEGGGVFGPSQLEFIITTSSLKPSGIAVRDFDADGFPDIFVTGDGANGTNANRFLKNEGGTGFAGVVLLSDIDNPDFFDYDNYTRTTAFDIEGDGDMDVAVHGGNSIKLIINNAGPSPSAAFDFGVNSPLELSFTNESIGDFTESLWDFGDSNTSTETNPTHTYTIADDYQVCLTMTGDGIIATTCQAVNLLTSVEDIYLSDISVYPNPFISSIQIDAVELTGTKINVELTDVSGKVVLSQKGQLPMNLELTSLVTQGNYILTVRSQENSTLLATSKIVKKK